MKFLTHSLAVLLTAGIIIWTLSSNLPKIKERYTDTELQHTSLLMKDFTDKEFSRIRNKLYSLGNVLARDVAFTMKFVVEKDFSSSEVVEKAEKYMKPMGLSLLEITDSNNRILSSGHFPARAGGKAGPFAAMVDSSGVFISEKIKGVDYLTCQVRIAARCAGRIIYIRGGIIAQGELLARIPERDSMVTFIRLDDDLYGIDSADALSFNNDGSVLYNNEKMYSAVIPLRPSDPAQNLELYILSPMVDKISLSDLFSF